MVCAQGQNCPLEHREPTSSHTSEENDSPFPSSCQLLTVPPESGGADRASPPCPWGFWQAWFGVGLYYPQSAWTHEYQKTDLPSTPSHPPVLTFFLSALSRCSLSLGRAWGLNKMPWLGLDNYLFFLALSSVLSLWVDCCPLYKEVSPIEVESCPGPDPDPVHLSVYVRSLAWWGRQGYFLVFVFKYRHIDPVLLLIKSLYLPANMTASKFLNLVMILHSHVTQRAPKSPFSSSWLCWGLGKNKCNVCTPCLFACNHGSINVICAKLHEPSPKSTNGMED